MFMRHDGSCPGVAAAVCVLGGQEDPVLHGEVRVLHVLSQVVSWHACGHLVPLSYCSTAVPSFAAVICTNMIWW